MTTNQQKTIDELKEYYNTINSIDHTNDIINAIEEVLNGKRIKKAKEEASKLAARSMAIEGSRKYAEQVLKPVMDRYLPKVDIGIWDDGTIHIHHGYSNFDIRPRIHCNKNKEEGYDECSFHGYRLDGYGVNPVAETPEQMSVFNEKFTKWVIDQVKI